MVRFLLNKLYMCGGESVSEVPVSHANTPQNHTDGITTLKVYMILLYHTLLSNLYANIQL